MTRNNNYLTFMAKHLVKSTFLSGMILALASIFTVPAQAEIPQKVTVQKVNIYGNTGDFDGGGETEIKNGKIIYEGDMRAGQRLADVSNIEYNLDFWNVGEEGGKEGMLFWKKDYGLATLTVNYEFADPGVVIKKGPDFEGLQTLKREDADNEPSVRPVVYHFKFSGGPNGTFEELSPYVSKSGPAKGRIIDRHLVSFDFPYDKDTQYPYGLTSRWLSMPWEIPGDPFYGYPENEDTCGIPLSSNFDNAKRKFAFVPSAFAKDSGARFTSFSGEVTVAPGHDLEDIVPAELDMVLAEGDHINTEAQSCAVIGFSDMTTFVMGPFTSMVLDKSPQKESKWSLLTGKIWANVKKMVKNGTMDIEMNQAVAGIKGTTFILEDTGDTSTIKVIEGEVSFKSLADESEVMVGSGETVQATSDGLSDKSTFDTSAETEKWKPSHTKAANQQDTSLPQPQSDNRLQIVIAVFAGIILFVSFYFFVKNKKVK